MSRDVQRRPFGLLILGTLIGTVVGVLVGSIYGSTYALAIGGSAVGTLLGAAVDTLCGRRDLRKQMAKGAFRGCSVAAVSMFLLQTLPTFNDALSSRSLHSAVRVLLLGEGHVLFLLLVILVGGILGAALALACALRTPDRASFRVAMKRSVYGYFAGLAIALAIVVIEYVLSYSIYITSGTSFWQHISFYSLTCLGAGFLSAVLWGLPMTSASRRLPRDRKASNHDRMRTIESTGNGDEPIVSKSPQEKAAILRRMADRAAQNDGA